MLTSQLSAFVTPWTITVTVILLIMLILALVPGLAAMLADPMRRSGTLCVRFAGRIWNAIKNIWKFDNVRTAQQEAIDKKVKEKVDEQQKAAPTKIFTGAEIATIRQRVITVEGEPHGPSDAVIADAWTRRLFYLALVLVCGVSDYVLVSTRLPILFGGGAPPPWLAFLFQYLQVITGVLFVSVAALSGLIIDEYINEHPDVVKITPKLNPIAQKIFLGLAIAMFALDIVVIITLTIQGVAFGLGQGLSVYALYVIFAGTTVIIALAILLVGAGLLEGARALGFLFIGGLIALGALLFALLFTLLSLLLFGLDALNKAIFGIGVAMQGKGGDSRPPAPDLRTLAIMGFGPRGSEFAVGICQQVGQLFGSYAWLAGITEPTLRDSLRTSRATDGKYLSVGDTLQGKEAAQELTMQLERYYRDKRDTIKPLLWVVAGADLENCLYALHNLGKNKGTEIKNIKLVILWLVPVATPAIKNLAAKLNTWAQEPDTILMTTLVFEARSPLADTLLNQQDDVLQRSVAALLGANTTPGSMPFATVVTQLHDSGYPFAALAAGSIGVDTSPDPFSVGPIAGNVGEINPYTAAQRLKLVAEEAFTKQRLSTVTDPWLVKPISNTDPTHAQWETQQENAIVNVVTPSMNRLRQKVPFKAFKDDVCYWLQELYGVNSEHVTVRQLNTGGKKAKEDPGINVGGQIPPWTGQFYFHFTALRGVGAGNKATPKELAGGNASPWPPTK